MAKKTKVVVPAKNYSGIVRAIRLTYDSLSSHLPDSIENTQKKNCCAKATGDSTFHRMCVKEYADIIKVLAEQL